MDCFVTAGSSGRVSFSLLRPAVYTLRVVATNRHPDKEFIKTRFEITDDPERCTLHLINGGVTVIGDDTATVEFASRGPARAYLCHLDKMDSYECEILNNCLFQDLLMSIILSSLTAGSSPVVLTGLSRGLQKLKVVPVGCGKNRRNLKADINIE